MLSPHVSNGYLRWHRKYQRWSLVTAVPISSAVLVPDADFVTSYGPQDGSTANLPPSPRSRLAKRRHYRGSGQSNSVAE